MYRYLPRHMFGFIQGKLFPKYFFLGTILSSITLITFLIENPFPSWERKQTIQVCTDCVLLYIARAEDNDIH